MINRIDDRIDELVDWNIESLADMFGAKADVLNNLQYDSLTRIFLHDGITPYDKKSNGMIDLEYKEMIETKIEIRGWGRNDRN